MSATWFRRPKSRKPETKLGEVCRPPNIRNVGARHPGPSQNGGGDRAFGQIHHYLRAKTCLFPTLSAPFAAAHHPVPPVSPSIATMETIKTVADTPESEDPLVVAASKANTATHNACRYKTEEEGGRGSGGRSPNISSAKACSPASDDRDIAALANAAATVILLHRPAARSAATIHVQRHRWASSVSTGTTPSGSLNCTRWRLSVCGCRLCLPRPLVLGLCLPECPDRTLWWMRGGGTDEHDPRQRRPRRRASGRLLAGTGHPADAHPDVRHPAVGHQPTVER